MFSAILNKYRKIWTQKRTQSAINAVDIRDNFRGMISFGVCTRGNSKGSLGAKFYTKTAPLTAVIDDVNNAVCDQDAISIKWLSPKSHGSSQVKSISNNQYYLFKQP
jgi:hypothetical protein